MKRYLFYNKPAFALLAGLNVLFAAGFVGFSLILQWLVNMVMAEGVRSSDFLIGVAISFAYTVAVMIVSAIKDRLNTVYINRAVRSLRADVAGHLLDLPYGEFGSEDSAKYLSHMTNDVTTLSTSYFQSIMMLPEQIATFVFAVGVAFFINWIVALVMLGLTMMIFIVPLIFNKPLNKANLELSERLKDYTSILKQTFLGMDVVKNFNAQDTVGRDIATANDRLCRKNTWLGTLNMLSQNVGITIVVLLQLGSIAVAGFLLIKGVLLIGAVVAVVQLGGNMYSPIMNVASRAALIAGVRDLGNTLVGLAAPVETADRAVSFEKSIRVKDLRFSYAEGEETVKGVDLEFEKGKKYLIVGSSGSGKSTLLKLIGKMYPGYEGEIYLDGAEYRTFGEKDFYRVAAVAQQKSYIFDRTVAGNIDFLGTGDAEQLGRAVTVAELDDFVAAQAAGLDEPIGEEINQISGGEKQRIGLARAVYKDSPLLLLDEVTSSLDKETAYAVERNVLAMPDKTVISVSHKLNAALLPLYDKILVLEKGRVERFAPYAEIGRDGLKEYMSA